MQAWGCRRAYDCAFFVVDRKYVRAMDATRLESILFKSAPLMQILRAARNANLPDWLLVSGAVFQTVWNDLTGRAPDYGIKDYDLFYFDACDLSYEAEDASIRGALLHFPTHVSTRVEVRNQARVHLWFPQKFGEPYEALDCSAAALKRFVSCTSAVGVRLLPNDRLHVEAPFGLDDIFGLRFRPNPLRPVSKSFDAVAASAQKRWPESEVIRPHAASVDDQLARHG